MLCHSISCIPLTAPKAMPGSGDCNQTSSLILSAQVPGPNLCRRGMIAQLCRIWKGLPQQDGVKHPSAGVQAAYGAIIAAGEQPCVGSQPACPPAGMVCRQSMQALRQCRDQQHLAAFCQGQEALHCRVSQVAGGVTDWHKDCQESADLACLVELAQPALSPSRTKLSWEHPQEPV